MKPLILSFFAVLLGYSLFIDKSENTKQNVQESIRSAQTKQQSALQTTDSIALYANEKAESSKLFLQ